MIEGLLVKRRVFVEVNLLVLALAHKLGSEAQAVAPGALGQRQFEVDFGLQVLLLDILLLLGHLFQREVLVEQHLRTLLWGS